MANCQRLVVNIAYPKESTGICRCGLLTKLCFQLHLPIPSRDLPLIRSNAYTCTYVSTSLLHLSALPTGADRVHVAYECLG